MIIQFCNTTDGDNGTTGSVHTLKPDTTLNRGTTYIYDTMNVLYSLMSMSEISNLLFQTLVSHTYTQVFNYLDRWYVVHHFDRFKKKKVKTQEPINLIFVVDDQIDPTKMRRNETVSRHMTSDRITGRTYIHIHTFTYIYTHTCT